MILIPHVNTVLEQEQQLGLCRSVGKSERTFKTYRNKLECLTSSFHIFGCAVVCQALQMTADALG